MDNPETPKKIPTVIKDNVEGSLRGGATRELEMTRKVQFVNSAIQNTEIINAGRTFSEVVNETCYSSKIADQDKCTSIPSHEAVQEPVEGEKPQTQEGRKVLFKAESPRWYRDHLRIIAYLVGELRAIVASSGMRTTVLLCLDFINDMSAFFFCKATIQGPQ